MSKRHYLDPLAAPPDIIRWAPRSRGHGDCVVAALEMGCGATYEHVLTIAAKVNADVLTQGLVIRHVKKIAKQLGYRVDVRRSYDLDEDTGILWVKQPHVKDSEHGVYLWEGRIIEPMNARQQLWLSAKAYLSHYKYKAGVLLVLTPLEERR